MGTNPDNDLMARFQAGDEKAFDDIVATYKARLYNFIRKYLGPSFSSGQDEAEDVLQDLFIRLYRSKNSYKPEQKLESFIYKIAVNLCKDRLRKTRLLTGLDTEKTPSTAATPQEQLDRNENLNLVNAAIAALPENQRLVFSLSVFEDKSYDEIVKITGFSLPSVKSLIFRAREKLKKDLGPRLS